MMIFSGRGSGCGPEGDPTVSRYQARGRPPGPLGQGWRRAADAAATEAKSATALANADAIRKANPSLSQFRALLAAAKAA